MHAKARRCVLFMWVHVLALVLSQECFLADFKASRWFDKNFDIANLEEKYPNEKQVRVTCVVGYTGFFKMTCERGVWSYKGTNCEPRSCGHPGDAQFADFRLDVGQDFVFGSQVVYTCHRGYQMVSRKNSRRCLAQGWDGAVPVCEALQCPVIRPDDNVQVFGDAEEANFGNVVRFSCKSNQEMLKGPAEIYCNEEGEWSGTVPKCEEIRCAEPQIENGRVLGGVRVYRENDILEYECNLRYKRTESRLIKCTKLGSTADWSPTPRCEPVKCRLPPGPVEGTSYDPPYQNVFLPGGTLTVNCEANYWIGSKQNTSVVTTCNDNGEWTVLPICNVVTCESRRPWNVNQWDVRWGQQIRMGFTTWYQCRTGYRSTARELECTRDGWKPDPMCQEKMCDRTEIENAVIRGNKQQYRIDEIATYDCNEGYKGNPSRVCRNFGWSGDSRCEVKGCSRLEIANAITQGNEWDSYRHGDKVQYQCAFNSDIHFTITCMKGSWDGIRNCSGCQKPHLPNGFVVYVQNKMHYACKEGYKLSSKGWWNEATCKDNLWDGFDEYCIENTKCGVPPQIPNGKIARQRGVNEDGSSVAIACEDGFLLQVQSLICEKGEWSSGGIAFTDICTPNPQNCGAPPKIDNAVVLTPYQKLYLSNSEVTYQCRATSNQGQDNTQTIRCVNGDWEKSDLTCTS